MKPVLLSSQLVLLVGLVLGCSGEPRRSGLQEVRAEEAADHVGEELVVFGVVAQVSETSSGTAFLNFGAQFPHQDFSAVVFERSRSKFDRISLLQGLNVRVRGVVRTYRGRPQIVLEDPRQLFGLDAEDLRKDRQPSAADTAPVGGSDSDPFP